jgi:hypothetical protein
MAPRPLPEDRASCSQNRRTLPLLGHWAGEWPRSQQKYALDQLASGTSGRLQGGRVSSDVHVLRLGLGTARVSTSPRPRTFGEESRSTRTWNGSFQPRYLLHHSDRNAERLPLIFPDAWPLNGYSTVPILPAGALPQSRSRAIPQRQAVYAG